jgi:hypothetical protein
MRPHNRKAGLTRDDRLIPHLASRRRGVGSAKGVQNLTAGVECPRQRPQPHRPEPGWPRKRDRTIENAYLLLSKLETAAGAARAYASTDSARRRVRPALGDTRARPPPRFTVRSRCSRVDRLAALSAQAGVASLRRELETAIPTLAYESSDSARVAFAQVSAWALAAVRDAPLRSVATVAVSWADPGETSSPPSRGGFAVCPIQARR